MINITKKQINDIHNDLLVRIKSFYISLYKNSNNDSKNDYTMLVLFLVISSAIESLIQIIVNEKYKNDQFAIRFFKKRFDNSGSFLEGDFVEHLISDYNYKMIKMSNFKNEFYDSCEDLIKNKIEQSGEKSLYKNDTFVAIYGSIKTQRNNIAHEFSWDKNDFSQGALIKFLKIYYTLYLYSKRLLADKASH